MMNGYRIGRLGACVAAAVLAGTTASGQVVVNPSFEELTDPGDQFLFVGWVDFTAYLNDEEVVPLDGELAAKQYGLSYYQFPFAIEGLPQEFLDAMPTWDLDGDGTDDCCDTIPANNSVLIQDIGLLPVGDVATLTFNYYHRSDDAPEAMGNLVQGILNFRDDPWPAPELGRAVGTVDLFSVPGDTWVEASSSAVVPEGTNFVEIVLIQFQFPTEYSPIDADGDGVQDVIGGTPQFDIVTWGTGASHWDVISVATEPDDCVGDWNGDGTVNTQDFIAFLGDWSAQRNQDCSQGDCSADLNGDGTVNTQDFIAFLGAWSAGCP